MRAEKRPQAISDVIRANLAAIDPSGRLGDYAAWGRWAEIVGPTLARQIRPLRLRDGVLVVGVASSVWMQELHFIRTRLRSQINEALGRWLVRDIRFVLAPPPRRPPARRYKRCPPAPPPLPGMLPAETGIAGALRDLWQAWVRACTQPRR